MKKLTSSRALALATALAIVPAVALSAPSAMAKVCENYSGPATKVPAQMGDKPELRDPHRPRHGKPADPSATPATTPVPRPTTDGTLLPHPTCKPRPEKPTGTPKPRPTAIPTTTPTSSANYS